MSESINLTLLIGHLADKPKSLPRDDGSIATIARLATNETWKDRETGEPKELTDWHSLIADGRTGEVLAQYGEKGKRVFIRGEKREAQYTDRNGVEHRDAEIYVREVRFLSSKGSRQADAATAGSSSRPAPRPTAAAATPPAAAPTSGRADPQESGAPAAEQAGESTELSGNF